MSFAAVEVVNPVDDSIVLPLFKVKLYPDPVPGREFSGSDEFDLVAHTGSALVRFLYIFLEKANTWLKHFELRCTSGPTIRPDQPPGRDP